jgi:NhaP-type Na+/H+ or K+/H+ antiporter
LRRSDSIGFARAGAGTANAAASVTADSTNASDSAAADSAAAPAAAAAEHEFANVEALGTVASLIVWFVFGAVVVLVCRTSVPGSVILYSVLVLTVVRMIPVYLAMLGTTASWLDRTLLGLVGPRGTTSIVFGLLAYNAVRDEDADLTLSTMTIVLVGSLLLHGVAVPMAAQRLRKTGTALSSPAVDEPAEASERPQRARTLQRPPARRGTHG